MSTKNKLYTLGYFRGRLSQEKISSKVLLTNFLEDDDRYWMISIDHEQKIICTCIKKVDEFYFEFSDGGTRIKTNRIMKTESMRVIIDFLKGILNN